MYLRDPSSTCNLRYFLMEFCQIQFKDIALPLQIWLVETIFFHSNFRNLTNAKCWVAASDIRIRVRYANTSKATRKRNRCNTDGPKTSQTKQNEVSHQLQGKTSLLKPRCHIQFTHAFSALHCVLKLLILVSIDIWETNVITSKTKFNRKTRT